MKTSFLSILTTTTILGIVISAHAGMEQKLSKKATTGVAARSAEVKSETGASSPATATKTTSPAKPATAPDPIKDAASAEKVVKYQINVIKQAKARSAMAAKNRDALHATYKNKNLEKSTYDAVMKRYEAADKEVAASDQALTTARGAFDILFDKYQKLGGTVDYRAQLP